MSSPQKVVMYCQEGGSDKEYRLELFEDPKGWTVMGHNGRRGGNLKAQLKCEGVSYEVALKEFDSTYKEKVNKKRYVPQNVDVAASNEGYAFVSNTREDSGLAPQLLNTIRTEAELESFIVSSSYVFQEKHDGERRPVKFDSDMVLVASNKEGMKTSLPVAVGRELESLAKPHKGMEIDGELVGDHFIAFDLLRLGGKCLRSSSFKDRLTMLHEVLSDITSLSFVHLVETAYTTAEKRALVKRLQKENGEGVAIKNLSAPYKPGRPSSGGDQLKFKFYEQCSLRVYGRPDTKRSVLVEGLNEQGETVDLGKITIPPNHDVPKNGDIVNIRYLYCYKGGKLFQTIYEGVRHDQSKPDTLDKLKFKQDRVYTKSPAKVSKSKTPKVKM